MSVNETLKARGENYDRGDYENTARVAQKIKEELRQGADTHWNLMTYGMRESLDMIANKLARIVAGNPFHADSWHDIAGYAALGERSVQLDAGEFEAIPTMGLTAADAPALYRALDGALGTIPASEQTKTEDAGPMFKYTTYNAGDKIEPVEDETDADTVEAEIDAMGCGDENCDVCNPANAVDDEDDSFVEEDLEQILSDVSVAAGPMLVVEEMPGVYRVLVDL